MPRQPLIHRLYAKIFCIWRARRQELFLREIRLSSGDTILDIGGATGFWEGFKNSDVQIICLNLDPAFRGSSLVQQGMIKRIHGDGCNLAYGDQSFSVGFSNSVIEHVGNWAKQKQFAQEILRVGRNIWVQTPAYECPIEPHFLAPFFHWLPKAWRHRFARNFTPWGWIQRPDRETARSMVDEIRLLTKKEMQELFPGCDIITEKLWEIFPKSYIAVRKTKATSQLRC